MSESKKIVHYIKGSNTEIKKGLRVSLHPVDHTSDLVSNEGAALTSVVQEVIGDGVFETVNSRYVPIAMVDLRKSDEVMVQVFNGNPESVGQGYMAVRGKNVVAFYVDVRDTPQGRLYPLSSSSHTVDRATKELHNFPSITLETGDDGSDLFVDITFPEFEGWNVHSCGGGKTLSICLVKHDR